MLDDCEARTALDEAQRVQTAVRRGSRWYVLYWLAAGIGIFLYFAAFALLEGAALAITAGVIWLATIFLLLYLCGGQRVARRSVRSQVAMELAWTAWVFAVVGIGIGFAADWGMYSLVAAFLCALPCFAVAYVEARR